MKICDFCDLFGILWKLIFVLNYILKITNMIAANYSEFRNELKNYLDNVEFNNETLIIKRGSGKGTVLISLDEYNSIMETLHLLSSKKNAKRLFESIDQIKSGKKVQHNLIEE
jgi:antitoxin YefM